MRGYGEETGAGMLKQERYQRTEEKEKVKRGQEMKLEKRQSEG